MGLGFLGSGFRLAARNRVVETVKTRKRFGKRPKRGELPPLFDTPHANQRIDWITWKTPRLCVDSQWYWFSAAERRIAAQTVPLNMVHIWAKDGLNMANPAEFQSKVGTVPAMASCFRPSLLRTIPIE